MKNNLLKNICIFACLIIVPLITLNLAFQDDLFKYNFTYLSTLNNTKFLYYCWSFITISTASISIHLIIKKYYLVKPTNFQIILLFFILFGASLVPYSDTDNILSFLHIFAVYIALIYFNYILYTLYYFMTLINVGKYEGYAYIFQFTTCFFISMICGSINSLVEIIYTISTTFILASLLIKK